MFWISQWKSVQFVVYSLWSVVQPIAFRVSFNPILQSQSNWSLFNGTWPKKRRELDDRLGFEKEESTLRMQQAIYM